MIYVIATKKYVHQVAHYNTWLNEKASHCVNISTPLHSLDLGYFSDYQIDHIVVAYKHIKLIFILKKKEKKKKGWNHEVLKNNNPNVTRQS